MIEVPAKNSSRECSVCHCTDSRNRPSQAVFRCIACGFEANADWNASEVIRMRGVKLLKSGEWSPKKNKKLLRVKSAKPNEPDENNRGGSPQVYARPAREQSLVGKRALVDWLLNGCRFQPFLKRRLDGVVRDDIADRRVLPRIE